MKINLIDSLKTLRKRQAEEILALNRVRTPVKRTTIFLQEMFSNPVFRPQRLTPIESFKTFVEKIIPKMQESVESNFLKAHFQKIASEEIKNSILQAYERRRINLEVNKRESVDITDPGDLHGLGITPVENLEAPLPITQQTQKDIGLYNVFPLEDFMKVFSKKGFGDYSSVELVYTEKFGVMCVEEAVKITEQLRSLIPIEKADYKIRALLPESESTEKLQERLKDAEIYKQIYHLLSVSFINALNSVRNDSFAYRLFSSAAVFDFLVSVLMQELPKKTLIAYLDNKSQRDKIASQIITQFIEKADKQQSNIQKLDQLITPIKNLTISLPDGKQSKYVIDLQQYITKSPEQPAALKGIFPDYLGFNSGVLYFGDQGTGKSGALIYLTMWAHKSNWIVVTVPNCYEMTQNEKYVALRHNATGLFMQYELGKSFLENFKSANEHLLKTIPVNKNLYGKYNVSGVHDNDPDTKPNIYYKDRKTYWKDHEQFIFPEEKKAIDDQDKFFETQRLSILFPEPQTLLDIVNYGIENEKLSMCAIGETLEQLYNLESHNVMVLVDEYNYLFRPSVYNSYRYANDKNLASKVPPYHIALCRLFMNFDGHKIKNGFKAVASSNKRFQRHLFNPDKILFPTGYSCEMTGLCLDDYRNMMKYYEQNKMWFPPDHEKAAYEQFWMETQGNWSETIKVITHFMRG